MTNVSGHAPDELRTAFKELVEAYCNDPDCGGPTLPWRKHPSDGLWELCGRLWNCTDVAPSTTLADLNSLLGFAPLSMGSSYAQAARRLRSHLGRTQP